jgi:hypothetical protein
MANQEEIGKMKFFDDEGQEIFNMAGCNSLDDEIMTCVIAKDEILAGFEHYHCNTAIRGVSFIIVKEKSAPKVLPHISAAFDMTSKLLCEKYQIPKEQWTFDSPAPQAKEISPHSTMK